MKKLFVHRTNHALGVGLLLAIATMSTNAQTVTGQTTSLPLAPPTAPLAQPVAQPAPQVVNPGAPIGINQAPYSYNRNAADNMDESTLLSEAARKQARLALLNINTKIEYCCIGFPERSAQRIAGVASSFNHPSSCCVTRYCKRCCVATTTIGVARRRC